MDHVWDAIDVGADIVVAQGSKAGGHGAERGTRFWATKGALVHENHHEAIIASNGDETIRTTVLDIARQMK